MGVDKDVKVAIHHLRQAADGGHAIAQYQLATVLMEGRGGEKDVEEAFARYQQWETYAVGRR